MKFVDYHTFLRGSVEQRVSTCKVIQGLRLIVWKAVLEVVPDPTADPRFLSMFRKKLNR